MTYEVKKHIKQDLKDLVLRKNQTVTLLFSGEDLGTDDHYRLYFTCEDRLHYSLKEEQYITKLYQLLDDSLDTAHAVTRRYCLDLSCKEAKPYPKLAMAKLMWPPMGIHNILKGATDQWELGIFCCRQRSAYRPRRLSADLPGALGNQAGHRSPPDPGSAG